MLSFWDRVWAVRAMAIRDYYKERKAQEERWEKFCQKCTAEILSECGSIASVISGAASKQTGSHVHKDLVDGIPELPLYGFYLVLRKQDKIAKEQENVLSMFFSTFSIPFGLSEYMESITKNNAARESLNNLVGISQTHAGGFWIQFFKVLYRTDEDTTNISKIIESFCSITMRFAALSGNTEEYLLTILEEFIKNVHLQSDLCRQVPNDVVDFYGDAPFIDHFKRYKDDTYKACNLTMDEDDENLNPKDFFRSFTLGIIYQVISRSTRSRQDKIKIIDDVLSIVDIDAGVDGAYIFKYMEDLQGEETSMLAAMMHILTDIEDGNPAGWIILTRGSGTYNLQTKKDNNAVTEAVNFIIGMENYLADKYPMSGFGEIASKYSKRVIEIINKDIDENVTIVD